MDLAPLFEFLERLRAAEKLGKKNKKARNLRAFFNVARSRGFEPLTAWFVARYSIQLSYERAVCPALLPRSRILGIAESGVNKKIHLILVFLMGLLHPICPG
jgi:hypothetical protein